MPIERERPDITELDPTKGLPWVGDAMELDPNEDVNDRWSAPPPPAIYEVELGVFRVNEVKYRKEDPKAWAYETVIQGAIISGDYQGSMAFTRVSTYVGRGRHNCTSLDACYKLGYGPAIEKKYKGGNGLIKIAPGELVDVLNKILAKGPKANWEFDWKAGYRDSRDIYRAVADSYEDFPMVDPKDPSKGRSHQLRVTREDGSSLTITASINVSHWFAKGEKLTSHRVMSVDGASSVIPDELEIDDLLSTPKETPPKLVSAPRSIKKAAAAQQPVRDEIVL